MQRIISNIPEKKEEYEFETWKFTVLKHHILESSCKHGEGDGQNCSVSLYLWTRVLAEKCFDIISYSKLVLCRCADKIPFFVIIVRSWRK